MTLEQEVQIQPENTSGSEATGDQTPVAPTSTESSVTGKKKKKKVIIKHRRKLIKLPKLLNRQPLGMIPVKLSKDLPVNWEKKCNIRLRKDMFVHLVDMSEWLVSPTKVDKQFMILEGAGYGLTIGLDQFVHPDLPEKVTVPVSQLTGQQGPITEQPSNAVILDGNSSPA